MNVSPQKKQLSIKDVAAALLLVHGGLFSDKELLRVTKLCQITFKDEDDHAMALWEWFSFGLYVIVEGIQDNTRGNETIGTAIAHQLFSDCFSHLKQAGLETGELTAKENEIKQIFERYNAIVKTGRPERLGMGAAASILGIDVSPGNIPNTFEAFELGTCVNQTYSASLNLVNKLFGEYAIVA
jgi:hypothetical protein